MADASLCLRITHTNDYGQPSKMIKAIKANFIPLIFLLVLSASLAGNVYLGRIVRSVRSTAQITHGTSQEARTHQQLGSMAVTRPDGSGTRISLRGDRPTILYVFSPSCSWCAKNFQNIQTLSVQSKDRYQFIGLSTGSHDLGDYLKTHHLSFPAYEGVSDSDLKAIDYRGTPQTVLVSSSGVVEHNWPGAYMGGTADAIQKFLNVRLPGLLTAPTSLPATATTVK